MNWLIGGATNGELPREEFAARRSEDVKMKMCPRHQVAQAFASRGKILQGSSYCVGLSNVDSFSTGKLLHSEKSYTIF